MYTHTHTHTHLCAHTHTHTHTHTGVCVCALIHVDHLRLTGRRDVFSIYIYLKYKENERARESDSVCVKWEGEEGMAQQKDACRS